MDEHVSPREGGTSEIDGAAEDIAAALGRCLAERAKSVAVAESLTGGLLVQAMARTEGSGAWLAGGVVAYSTSVKRRVLGVTAGKVVSRQAAEEMATGVRAALGADISVAVTGVAGPDEQDGEPPGSVWIGVDDGTAASATWFGTAGSPSEICAAAVVEALRILRGAAEGMPA
jgi:nicotinamide-nucleotide amidase